MGWYFFRVWAGAAVQLAAEAVFCLGARREPVFSSEVIIFFLTTCAHTPRKGSDPLQQEPCWGAQRGREEARRYGVVCWGITGSGAGVSKKETQAVRGGKFQPVIEKCYFCFHLFRHGKTVSPIVKEAVGSGRGGVL